MTDLSPRNLLLAAALVAALPLADAHWAAGTPKGCETPWEVDVHDYGPSTGFYVGPPVDGAGGMPCGRRVPGDGHAEYAQGGAYLLVSDPQAFDCYGHPAHHPQSPITVTVEDVGLALFLVGAPFTVAADRLNNVPAIDPNQIDCGDGLADSGGIDCYEQCTIVGFPPGLDGAFPVYVSGTQGHVYAW